jgi:glycosyl transferase family 25
MIVLINLDRDADRLAHMRAQLDGLGLSFERFPAVRGADLPERLRSYFPSGGEAGLSAGEIGCYASHLVLMQRIVAGELKAPVLVLEDDVALPDDLPALVDDLLAKAPAGWDMIRLSNPPKRAYAKVADLAGDRKLVRYSVVPGSTGAYLISAAGAAKFLARKPRTVAIDQDLRRVWDWDIDNYGVAPMPIIPDVLQASSIDTMAAKASPSQEAAKVKRPRRRNPSLIERHGWNIRVMGLWRWLRCELVNLAVSLTPRHERSALLMRASNWLA